MAGKENTLMYMEVWKKSFLLEIVYDGDNMESFTFSLPPQGIEITITQRTSETETFGGAFIDDYGIGLGKIHLSGNTGNSNVKTIYRGNRGEIQLTGKDEIYYIRDKVIRYKESNQWKDKDKPAIINLYNLGSNHGGIDDAPVEKSASMDAWEVVLKDFKITQNSSQPFIYNYSIDFIAIRILGESKINSRKAPVLTEPLPEDEYGPPLGNIKKLYRPDRKPTNEDKNDTIMDKIRNVTNSINIFNDKVKRRLALINNTIDNVMRDIVGPYYSVVDVYNTFKDCTMAPADAALRMIQTVSDLRKSVELTLNDITSLPEQWVEKIGSVEKSLESEIRAYKSYFEDNIQELENSVNKKYAETVSGANPEIVITSKLPGVKGEEIAAVQDGQGGTVEIIVAYGYMRHIATSETTLEKMAEIYLGDPDKAQMLAIINGVSGDDEINPGDQLKIPILSENSLNSLNQIFGSANNRDALGIDIALENGILQVGPNGDFMQQVDYENMNQAISMRLSESIGRRIRLNTYGIRNVGGMPDSVATAYIATSIKDTVMQDPRVARVDNLIFRGIGDALFVSFDFYTYDGVLRKYKGSL